MLIIHDESGLITSIQKYPDTTNTPHITVESIPPSLPLAVGLIRLSDNGNGWELPLEEDIQSLLDVRANDYLAQQIRRERDQRINNETWRYERHARETRLELTQTDDLIVLDDYIQALADIPNQPGFPHEITWPTHSL